MLNLNNLPKSNNEGLQAPLLDIGGYPGRLVQVIDLGLHPNSYQGEEKAPVYKIWLTYELSDEFMLDEDGEEVENKPRWLSEELNLFSLSSEKAKSTKRYAVLDPEGKAKGNFALCIGAPVLVSVVHNPNKRNHGGRPYENVGGISSLRPKDIKNLSDLVNPPKVFDLDAPDFELFSTLPKFLRDKITSNLEFKGSKLAAILEEEEYDTLNEDIKILDDLGEEIPF